ncbi:hypothetical protein [Bifidobacterium crudilactis]|jgi:hypothetical protein|uniref:hypothetical protein n=1 Tax=Bifidobacterium crudilactis TaxID=327277 RepID=UPI0023559DEE|nr:hypothetical protein [Bifidobacterium crudilactis]MCI1218515.1 hypothetical protein [Bifidobacterium crudilactis]
MNTKMPRRLRASLEVSVCWAGLLTADVGVLAVLCWLARRLAAALFGVLMPWWLTVLLAPLSVAVPLACWLVGECRQPETSISRITACERQRPQRRGVRR